MKTLKLAQYISEFYGSHGAKTRFAKAMGVRKQLVQQWLANDFLVALEDEKQPILVSKRAELPIVVKAFNNFSVEDKEDYPLYCHYNGQHQAQPAFISLDIRTGAISATFDEMVGNGVPSDVWHNLELRFSCHNLVHKDQINNFINENLDRFQSLLSVYKDCWDGSNYRGTYLKGFEESEILLDLEHFIKCELINEWCENLITDVSDIYFEDTSILPLKKGDEVRKKIEEEFHGSALIGIDFNDIDEALVNYLFEKFCDNYEEGEEGDEWLNDHKWEVFELYNRYQVSELDAGSYEEELETAYNRLF